MVMGIIEDPYVKSRIFLPNRPNNNIAFDKLIIPIKSQQILLSNYNNEYRKFFTS
uniref:Uncharacterized protein n=1 Tax=Rhizophagus irregularis (strain DAOM 181602 / DAOM 197198 / MUCL 43194) TaxID=747089 RepID=U9TY23_RHIID